MTKARMPFVLWLTGLSGSGKSTLADKIANSLSVRGYDFERLDGDTLRGVFPSTGFSRAERDEHIQRVGFMSGLLEKHGVIVIASFISPYRQARDFVRKRCRNFIEVYVKASLATCEARDVKGLYKKARTGQIREFTGIDDPYEEPVNPELVIEADRESVEESTQRIIGAIQKFL
jgi:adenylylsulfate kinase